MDQSYQRQIFKILKKITKQIRKKTFKITSRVLKCQKKLIICYCQKDDKQKMKTDIESYHRARGDILQLEKSEI